jgi:hypothetical protein
MYPFFSVSSQMEPLKRFINRDAGRGFCKFLYHSLPAYDQLASTTTFSPLGCSCCSSARREMSSLCSVMYFE